MFTIDINRSIGIKTTLFPDNQPHVNINGVPEGSSVEVYCSLTDAQTLLMLLECSNALDKRFAQKEHLIIPYLMGARMDRIMQPGDSFDLQVIAQLINSCGFKKVTLVDPHSDVATALIHNVKVVDNAALLHSYNSIFSNAACVLICPDAGAAKKIDKYTKHLNIEDIVFCTKKRDLSTGAISLQVLSPEKCTNKICLIVDDICDGGRTFLNIADQIEPDNLILVVTHGIFSQGLPTLKKQFDWIITTDSLCKVYSDLQVYQVPVKSFIYE